MKKSAFEMGGMLAAVGMVLGSAALGNTWTWTKTGTGPYEWQAAANWNPPTGWPALQDDVAIMQNGGWPHYINLGGTLTMARLEMWPGTWSGFIITNGTLVFSSSTGTALISDWNVVGRREIINAAVRFDTNTIVRVLYPTWSIYNAPDSGSRIRFQQPIAGNFGLYKDGPGGIGLEAVNTFTGTITIANGQLIPQIANWGVLGAGPNELVLGSPGARGSIGWLVALPPLTNAVTLSGLGGALYAWQSAIISNVFSGTGELVFGPNAWQYITNSMPNTHSGGTRVWNPLTYVRTPVRVFGSGDVRIENLGAVRLDNPTNNVAPGAKVYIGSTGRGLAKNVIYAWLDLAGDSVPTIDTNSSGCIGLNINSGPNINARFATNAPQLGNGYMAYGCRFVGATFTGSSLQPNLDGWYRFLNANQLVLDEPSGTAAGVLKGTNGVDVAAIPGIWSYATLYSQDNNDFSGPLLVRHNAMFQGRVRTTGHSFGNNSSPVFLRSGLLNAIRASGGSTMVTVQKGTFTFEGSSMISVDNQNDASCVTRFDVAELVRTNRGILAFATDGGTWALGRLGTQSQFRVMSAEPVPTNGIVPPYFVNYYANAFLTYNPGFGFSNAAFTINTLTGAVPTSICNVTNTESVPSGGVEVYALRVAAGNIYTNPATPGDRIKIGSGGLILTAWAGNNNNADTFNYAIRAPIDFGDSEGVIYLGYPYDSDTAVPWGNCSYCISNKIYGSQGLTIGSHYRGNPGPRFLTLFGDNTDSLTGTITINQGVVQIWDSQTLGPDSNLIVLNGGTGEGNCSFAGLDFAPTVTRTNRHPIWLGPEGGTLYARYGYRYHTHTGKISGPGMLAISGHGGCQVILLNDENDYAGGTYVRGAQLRVGCTYEGVITGTGKLGSGPVVIGGTGGDNNAGLLIWGTNAIAPTQSVAILQAQPGTGDRLELRALWTRIGSLEGNGRVLLSSTSGMSRTTLYVGCNNRSTEFSGFIHDESVWVPGSLVKEGTGTFTLSGYNCYGGYPTFYSGYVGETKVVGGTLLVNGTVLTPTYATNGTTLGGCGVLASNVVVNGGTLAPGASVGILRTGHVKLYANSTFEVELNGTAPGTQHDQLKVSGWVDLGGSALSIKVGYTPTIGDTFTIIDNDGTDAVTNQFAQGRGVIGIGTGGKAFPFMVNYAGGDGNDVVLTSVPAGTIITIR